MKATCAPRYNIGCLRFQERMAEVETIQISEALHVDIAPDGTVCGLEFLNATEQRYSDNGGHFAVVSEAAGKTGDIFWGIWRTRREHRIGDCLRLASSRQRRRC